MQTALLICAVLLWAGVQYGLMAWAVRDLLRRPSVRGNNKVLWAILILTVPIAGALVYVVIAPVTPFARLPRSIASPAPLGSSRRPRCLTIRRAPRVPRSTGRRVFVSTIPGHIRRTPAGSPPSTPSWTVSISSGTGRMCRSARRRMTR